MLEMPDAQDLEPLGSGLNGRNRKPLGFTTWEMLRTPNSSFQVAGQFKVNLQCYSQTILLPPYVSTF